METKNLFYTPRTLTSLPEKLPNLEELLKENQEIKTRYDSLWDEYVALRASRDEYQKTMEAEFERLKKQLEEASKAPKESIDPKAKWDVVDLGYEWQVPKPFSLSTEEYTLIHKRVKANRGVWASQAKAFVFLSFEDANKFAVEAGKLIPKNS